AVEGKRWLDDAFACGETSDATRAMALAARGLLQFLAGVVVEADTDLQEALEIFRELNNVAGIAFTLSFYAETARMQGNMAEAHRRRRQTLDLYLGEPDDAFVFAARAYSHAILAMIDGDLLTAERHYREAAHGFGLTDRPVMRSMALGIL